MTMQAISRVRALRALLHTTAAVVVAGCAQDTVSVSLDATPPAERDIYRLNVHAQVTGSSEGLRYKWFSVSGECAPQESDLPATVFKFANGATRDRVSVEVWRGAERLARSEIAVAMGEQAARAAMPQLQINVVRIPPYEPGGGPDTRGEIGGKVTGELAPAYKVLVYALADVWYIQPHPDAFHDIRPDGTWSTWTHTGSSYAALVVRRPFDPRTRLDVLPQIGDNVLARTIVEGTR